MGGSLVAAGHPAPAGRASAAAQRSGRLEAFNDPSRHRCDGDGRLVIWMPPAFPPCSTLAVELMAALIGHIRAHRLPLQPFGADARFMIDPEQGRWVTPDGALEATLTEPDDELELEDLVPGWRLPLRELWALSDG